MSKRRDLVVLSAILTAPLAILLATHFSVNAEVAEVVAEPAPVVACELPAPAPALPEPAPEPAPVVAPAPAPAPVVAPEPPAPTRDPSQFMLMHDADLVLDSGPELAWSSGKIGHRAAPGEFVAWRPAVADRLPEPVRALLGATVSVYSADGSACIATVGAARVQVERTGDVFEVSTDTDEGSTYEPPADASALKNMSRETFAGAGADGLLLARQRNRDDRACTGLWARRADLPAPAVFGLRDLSPEDHRRLTDDALALVRALPEFADVRDAYAARLAEYGPEYAAEQPSWDTWLDANFRVDRWDEVGGPRTFVSVELREEAEGCGDWFSEGFALILERQGEQLAVRQPGWFDLAALTDLDRDGTLEGLVTGEFGYQELMATGPNAAAVADTFSIPFWGCSC